MSLDIAYENFVTQLQEIFTSVSDGTTDPTDSARQSAENLADAIRDWVVNIIDSEVAAPAKIFGAAILSEGTVSSQLLELLILASAP